MPQCSESTRMGVGDVALLLAAMSDQDIQRRADILYRRIMADPPQTLNVVAAAWGLSTQRVHQIEGEILRVLRRLSWSRRPASVGAKEQARRVAPHGTPLHDLIVGRLHAEDE